MVDPGPKPHVGGPIVAGAPTVLVAGMAQARAGDQCTCTGPPDMIAKGSPTVLIGGKPAARMGDQTVHGGIIAAGAPNVLIGMAGAGGAAATPSTVAPDTHTAGKSGDGPDAIDAPYKVHKARLGGDDNVDVMFAEAGGSASAGDGRATAQGEVALGGVRMDHSGRIEGTPFGGSHKLQSLTADAKAYGSVGWTGIGGQAEASARVKEQKVSAHAGSEHHPYAEIGVGYSLIEGEAKLGGLIGSDGRQTGLAAQAEASYAHASGEIEGEFNIPIPFSDWTFSIGSKAKGSVGDVSVGGSAHAVKREDGLYSVGASGNVVAGAKAEVHAGQNKDTGRSHFGLRVGGKLLAGIDLSVDFSLGPKPPDRRRRD
jgi:uncharacterized Zn-binding protein involved in type VI secretion